MFGSDLQLHLSQHTLLFWIAFSLPLQIGNAHVYLFILTFMQFVKVFNKQLQTSNVMLPHLWLCVYKFESIVFSYIEINESI